jgi:hypothetical protein
MEIFTANQSWIYIFLIFLAVIGYFSFMQRRDTNFVLAKFGRENILLSSFGVNYFGLASEPGGPARSAGILVLVKDGLYYKARFSKRELFIPGNHLKKIEIVDVFKNKPLHQKVLAFVFIDGEGKEDKTAIRIPHPGQWVDAIKATFSVSM